MCQFEGENYYITGIANVCKSKDLAGKPSQCLQPSSRFVSVASYRAWIEKTSKLLMDVSTLSTLKSLTVV